MQESISHLRRVSNHMVMSRSVVGGRESDASSFSTLSQFAYLFGGGSGRAQENGGCMVTVAVNTYAANDATAGLIMSRHTETELVRAAVFGFCVFLYIPRACGFLGWAALGDMTDLVAFAVLGGREGVSHHVTLVVHSKEVDGFTHSDPSSGNTIISTVVLAF